MADNPLLIVEGRHDALVFAELLKKHDLVVAREENGQEKEIVIKEQGGFENLKKNLRQILKVADNSLAIVVDADDKDIGDRWRSLTDRLKNAGYSESNMPSAPLAEGTKIEDNELPTVGIWIMPDNSSAGKIETFLKKIVADDNSDLFQFAEDTIKKLPKILFEAKDEEKAQIHTYLAWQKKPGISMGTAIQAKCFQYDKPEANNFVQWIKNVFNL
jgi:hypothetical protein